MNVREGTIHGYNLILRQFCVFVRNCPIESIRLEDVTAWFSIMRDLSWQHNSFIPKAMALRKFFEFWRRRGKNVLDPWLIPIPSKQYNIPRVLDEPTYQKFVAAIPEKTTDPRHIRNRAIVSMLWDTGARHGEILALDTDDLQLDRQRAIIKTEKSKGARPFREIFWTQPTHERVVRWMEKREKLNNTMAFPESKAVFVSVCSGKKGQRFTLKGSGEMLRRYSARAGMPVVNAHSFRHHMGHDIINQGGSSADVMNILGHATLASSSIYTMMTNKELEGRYRTFKGD